MTADPECVNVNVKYNGDKVVRFADVGCGFGGMLIELGRNFPDVLSVGMEIRDKVSKYVHERILSLREQYPGDYQNVALIRTNAMKFITNYFEKGQLEKIFFLFPDPHFKKKKHRRRIITPTLLSEYAYLLQGGGLVYTITDVKDLADWMHTHLENHPLFERVADEDLKDDVAANLLFSASEEARKVKRNNGDMYRNVYRRKAIGL